MRCSRCGRRGSIRKAARTPSGRLAFGWCEGCLTEVGLIALGLPVPSRLADKEEPKKTWASPDYERVVRIRSKGLVATALAFSVWGIVVTLVGLSQSLSFAPLDVARSPWMMSRARLLASGGALVAVVSLASALTTLDRDRRRVDLLRMARDGYWALALAVLTLHSLHLFGPWNPRAVCIVVGAAGLGWAAHVVEGRVSLSGIESEEWPDSISIGPA